MSYHYCVLKQQSISHGNSLCSDSVFDKMVLIFVWCLRLYFSRGWNSMCNYNKIPGWNLNQSCRVRQVYDIIKLIAYRPYICISWKRFARMALHGTWVKQGVTNWYFRYSINIDKNRLFSILIIISDYYRKSIAKPGVIIDFDWLFKLSSISIDFYRKTTSFLPTSAAWIWEPQNSWKWV